MPAIPFPQLDGALIGDLLAALALRRARLRPLERSTRAAVRAAQRRRLAAILEHAARRSSFYRRRWGGRIPDVDAFTDLEPVTRSELLVDGFDAAVTTPGLGLGEARRMLAAVATAAPVAPRAARRAAIRLVATSGTTGEPVIVPFSRRDWREGMAHILRSASLALTGAGRRRLVRGGVRRPRLAGISTLNPIHISTQLAASFHSGLVPALRLPASHPLDEQMRELERFQPTVLGGYPSAIDPLARAALDGALRIAPELVFTGGETVTGALRERVQRAWGCRFFDFYGLTETMIIAGECRAHQGLHIYEDAAVLEVVDDHDRVLPAGERGAGLLVTSLINHTLPIIRYRVSDLVAISDEPCPCGLPFARITAIEGRSEDMLLLAGTDGRRHRVHPFIVETPIEEMGGAIRQYRVEADSAGGLDVTVVPASASAHQGGGSGDSGDRGEGGKDEEGEAARLAARLEAAIVHVLAPLGVDPRGVRVKLAAGLRARRGPTDKQARSPGGGA